MGATRLKPSFCWSRGARKRSPPTGHLQGCRLQLPSPSPVLAKPRRRHAHPSLQHVYGRVTTCPVTSRWKRHAGEGGEKVASPAASRQRAAPPRQSERHKPPGGRRIQASGNEDGLTASHAGRALRGSGVLMAADVHASRGFLITAATCNTPREERARTRRAATTKSFFPLFVFFPLWLQSGAWRFHGAAFKMKRFAITND